MKVLVTAVLALFMLALSMQAAAQSDGGDVPLGDLARALRHKKPPPAAAPPIIDNDNFSQVMDEVEKRRQSDRSPVISFDNLGKTFQVAAPDVTCSLAFNASSASLLSAPYQPQDLPPAELRKLDGPASIDGDTLRLAVYNGSSWNVKEITIGLMIVPPSQSIAKGMESGRIIPAVATDAAPEKRADRTILYHLKGSAAPFSTTVFREPLDAAAANLNGEWHWAIVEAKGVPAADNAETAAR